MRENRFLRDRMIGRDSNQNGSYDGNDYRNKYGSAGGYVSSSRDRYGDEQDYRRGRDSRRDRAYFDEEKYSDQKDFEMRDYHSDPYKKYNKDLEEWMNKLSKYDKFRLPKEEIIRRAESMGVRFDDYSEEEFLATYYMILSDCPNDAQDSGTYIYKAKKWLEDPDIAVSPSEKLSIYYYCIVRG